MRKYIFLFVVILGINLPGQAQYDLSAIQNQIDQQAYNTAKQTLAALLAEYPKDPKLHYLLGYVYFQEKDYERAQAIFEAGTRIRRNYYLNRVGLGRVLAHLDKKVEALATLNEIAEDRAYWGKEDREVDYAMAQAYLEAGAFKEAEVLLYQLQAHESDNPRSYIALGDYYMAKGVGKLALNQYEQANQLDPTYIPAYTRIGKLKIEAQNYKDGARMISKAIGLDSTYAPSYRERGELYFKAKMYDKAREDYREYVRLTGNDLAARHRLAEFLYLSGAYEETIAELEDIDTTTNVKLRLLGYSYLETDQPDQVLSYLDTYFSRMNPRYTIAADYEMYGKALLKLGKTEEADQYFADAFDRDAARVVLYRDLAREYKAVKDYRMEAHYRELYLQNKPEKKHNNYYNLGIAWYKTGEYQQAWKVFEQASKVKEDHIKTYSWLMRVANKLENLDTTSVDWLTLGPAEQVVARIGGTPKSKLDKGDLQTLATAYQILAFYHFDPKGEGKNDCTAASTYLQKALHFDPENSSLIQMRDYCDSLGNN